MIHKTFYLKVILLLLTILVLNSANHAREITMLQTGWKFAYGHQENAFEINFDDSRWQDVSIPHDWAIKGPTIADGDGNTGKLPWKGEGWYRKKLNISKDYMGKTIYLLFDGVMSSPEIYLNGKLAGKWDYGYNSFYLDVTEFINVNGENVLAVHADTRQHDSRWYPGAGIYRKVQLIAVDQLHVGIWGNYITTPVVKSGSAEVRIITTVFNKAKKDAGVLKIENIIIDPAGKEIARKEIRSKINAGKNEDVETIITLYDPKLWDVDNPVLYHVRTNIYKGNELTDSCSTNFGIRTINIYADKGLYLNGRHVQLKGVCLHHDQGPLGAAFYPRAMERQLEIMKAMGCNAIRTSHNMAAPELLDLCDSMGMLVFDEAFDKYDKKADISEGTGFDEFSYRNIRNFVMRDRNHPSVFLWSVGNEIWDVQNNKNNGFARLNTMVSNVRKYDSTRPVTLVCDDYNSPALRHFDYYDIHSWNYGRRYRLARQLEPNKPVIISESASTVSTRGFYELPLPEKKTDFTKSLQVSSYDLNAPAWAEVSDDEFMWQQDEPYIAGEFVWTGFDYLGEPTPYDNGSVKNMGMKDQDASRSSYFGIVDLCGIPKDRYYLYKSHWKPEETTIHILPHWNWKDKAGQKIPVFVYTNGDSAELFLNGKSQGMEHKHPDSKNSIERFRLMWSGITYEPGELKAVAYKNGKRIGEETIRTACEPYKLRLSCDRQVIKSGGLDLSYILVEALDKDGNICPLANNKIDISIRGTGRISGVGNGNPQSFEDFQSDTIKLFYGKAMIIVGSGSEKGEAVLTAASEGLLSDIKTIKVN